MSLRTASRLLLGFVLGIAVGWLAGLLRPLPQAPDTSSAADAAALPQNEFGHPTYDARNPVR